MKHSFFYNYFLIKQLRLRPRLFIAAFVGICMCMFIPVDIVPLEITRILIGWNVGACLYLIICTVMMVRSDHEMMHRRAAMEDEGQLVILALVVLSAIASLAAIIAELAVVKDMAGAAKFAHIGLAVLTILSSWAFTHMMFAMHYTHDYYLCLSKKMPVGLDFPNDNAPLYGDFCYLSFVIGTSGQTADVSFTSKAMRRIGLLHCVLSFLFNTTLLALTINIAASLF